MTERSGESPRQVFFNTKIHQFVEFVFTNSTLNYLKGNCLMDASQIINNYDKISDVILIANRNEMDK